MKKANITQIKNKLSEYLRYVKKGDTVRIYHRNQPIADLVPITSLSNLEKKELGKKLESLESQGVIRIGRQKLGENFHKRLKKIIQASESDFKGTLEELLEERRRER